MIETKAQNERVFWTDAPEFIRRHPPYRAAIPRNRYRPSGPISSVIPSLPEHLRAWEEEYREKGRLWKGAPAHMPDLPAGSRVLELGCGNGKTLSAIQRQPWRATALDVSVEAVRLCRKQVASSARLLTADACNLPFRDAVFDAVFAFYITGHLPGQDRRRMALEAARVLRSGGTLFFLDWF